MPRERKDFDDDYWNLMNVLADFAEDASDEDILAEAESRGEDSQVIARKAKEVLSRALSQDARRKLERARTAYDHQARLMRESRYDLPTSPSERRALLDLVVSRKPDLRSGLTVQFREYSEMSDSDVESCLKDLAELGALGEALNGGRKDEVS